MKRHMVKWLEDKVCSGVNVLTFYNFSTYCKDRVDLLSKHNEKS